MNNVEWGDFADTATSDAHKFKRKIGRTSKRNFIPFRIWEMQLLDYEGSFIDPGAYTKNISEGV